MSEFNSPHPSARQLAAFGQGRLSPEEQARIEGHIAECDECCRTLRSLPEDTLIENLQRSTASFADPVYALAELPAELIAHPRYRVVKVLGAGGMGVVYQAVHRLMRRTVALKVINRALTRNPIAVERFQREVRAAGQLAHPNIVTAHDADQAGALHCLVMEYVEGISLAKLVEAEGPLAVRTACQYALKAALGLQHAFERGMVHRDIKPQNLMLTSTGQIKILDFGLARFALEAEADEEETLPVPPVRRLTTLSMFLGTPDFVAPEQISDSRQADVRADIYSLGCTLYFLLAGGVPFPEGSVSDKLQAHARDTARPLHEVRGDVPAALVGIVAKMMAKDPCLRHQTPAEVVKALTPLARASPVPGEQKAPAPVPAALQPASVSDTLAKKPTPLPGPYQRFRLLTRPRILTAIMLLLAVPLLVWGITQLSGTSANQSGTGSSSAHPAPGAGKPQPTPGKKVVLFLLAPEYRVEDYSAVREVLEAEGKARVVVASNTLNPCKPLAGGKPGASVQPDLTVTHAKAEDFDALVLPGGAVWVFMSEPFPDNSPVDTLIRDMLARKKQVTALTEGQRLVAESGLLMGKKAALDPKMIALFKKRNFNPGAIVEPAATVVADGNIITASGSQYAGDLGRLLLEKLGQAP